MIDLLFLIFFFEINNSDDLINFGTNLSNLVDYDVSPDVFPIIYSLITGKGDCFNYYAISVFALKIRGISFETFYVFNNNIPVHVYFVAFFNNNNLIVDVAQNTYFEFS